jgi:Zn-dependent protease
MSRILLSNQNRTSTPRAIERTLRAMSETLANALVWYGVFLFATTCHEAAHAATAYALGDPTAYRGGQVTLSPLPHIRREPIGTVVVPLLSLFMGGQLIGWASAPFDPEWAERHPRRAATMAIAGPAANLTLLLVAGLCLRGGMELGWFGVPRRFSSAGLAVAPDGVLTWTVTVLSICFSLNLLLFVLNLIPFPPLDGAGALALVLPTSIARAYRTMLRKSPYLPFLGLYLAWQLIRPLNHAAFGFAIGVLWFPHLG